MANETKTFGGTFEDYELVDGGEYEVILAAEPKTYGADNDKQKLACKFKIRDDVEQKFKGRSVFDDMFLDKSPDWAGWYDHRKLHKILLTQTNPKLQFKNSDEAVQYINGLAMRVTVVKKYDDFKGREVNEIKYLSYAPSKAPLKAAEKPVADPTQEEETDDLPF